ncbi:hypothetical protein WJX73_009286 [Symbiochloris irregularis]|uniref:Translation elongation factor EF1B beta/delta subunit guanine nucleotide exchange domain-containing protein n=1 Tax=Symbiochloris irregularis TaxID=706552 RepID=A0AAW1NLA3_9CHLO
MASFSDLSGSSGLGELDSYLLTRSYISGYQASRDDLSVFSALSSAPSSDKHPNAARWYSHIAALLGKSFPGKAVGVKIAGSAASGASGATSSATSGASASTAVKGAPLAVQEAATPAAKADDDDDEVLSDLDDDDDDDDMDLFGEVTEEEKAARQKVIEAAKKRGAEKAKLTKSMIVLDVKPWDDTTDLKAMEDEVRAIKKDGLLWGACKLVPVGYGIRKMQITAVIEDAKVESMDAIIEEELVRDGESDNIQSIDVVSFNKL